VRACPSLAAALPPLALGFLALGACSSDRKAPPPDGGSLLFPGEQVCDPNAPVDPTLRFDPPEIVVAPGQRRPVRVIADPDVCRRAELSFESTAPQIFAAPAPGVLDLRKATHDFEVMGEAVGDGVLRARFVRPVTGTVVVAELPVSVRTPELPACAAGDATSGTLSTAAPSLSGKGTLATSSVSAPKAAFDRKDELALPIFEASIACDESLAEKVPGRKLVPISPAVRFWAAAPMKPNVTLRREIDFTIPVNPAAVPEKGRMRHLEVLFSSPRAKVPRPVPVTNPWIEKDGKGGWVLHFRAPYFGTYQATFDRDAGTRTRKRRIAHRAVLGVSMGGGGAATFGIRHHDQFDAVAPLGGPSDWNWFLWYIEHYPMGGFCPASNPNCPKFAPNEWPFDEVYAHSMDFEHWWYEKGSGNGGGFPRSEYMQALTDLAILRGNPNGDNDDPLLGWFARGPKASDPWVKGDTTGLPAGQDCRMTVEPLKGDPNNANMGKWREQCRASRCDPKNALVFPTGYFDGEFNPDGSKQVISFCDQGVRGAARDAASPYGNTWAPAGADSDAPFPLSMALAVDLNKNGVRDAGEPVLRQGHEPWQDTGEDGKASKDEPGYDPDTNPDPSQDDYDPFLNPGGTEGNHHYEPGEPYLDYGLDGVPNTKGTNVVGDVGEGDGKYTLSKGLKAFAEIDPHAAIRRWNDALPGGALDDDALARLNVLADGGVRDLFNFGSNSRHLIGAIASRRYANGAPIQSTGTVHGFHNLPGQDRSKPFEFQPTLTRWADVPSSLMLWYGNEDATAEEIDLGDGMHVGTAAQILSRIELSFFYVAQRWPDADRLLTEPAAQNPETTTKNELGTECEIRGRCEKIFTGPNTGRTGPIAVTLPPGYALEENRLRDTRYPVVFVLHGYGQDPRDLEALALITNNFMNDGLRSYASRLPKFIVVYVDGRCRVGKDGAPECYQGTFYLNSTRKNPQSTKPYENGANIEDWFQEVIQYIDANYRTMPATEIEVTD
jgi:hypothetical protein